jgi:hypothetical protein
MQMHWIRADTVTGPSGRAVSVWTDFYRRGRVKTRPRVIARLRCKCGWTGLSGRRPRMDGRNGHPDGHFCPKSSFLTSLPLVRRSNESKIRFQ